MSAIWPDLAPVSTGEPWEWALALVVALVLIALAGLLVAAEVAVTRVVSVGLEATYGERAVKASPAWERVAADPTAHLNMLLFLRVVCEVCAVLAAGIGMVFLLGIGWPAIVLTAVVMIVMECVLIAVTPRILGRQFAGPVAQFSAAVIHPVQIVLGPLARLLVGAGRGAHPARQGRPGGSLQHRDRTAAAGGPGRTG